MNDSFIEALAKPQPVPGGGAAAAHGACVGLALLEKIVLVELRRDLTSSESQWQNLLEEVRKSASTLLQLRDEDGKAYVRFAQAKTFGKSEGEVLASLQEAIDSPLKIIEEADKALNLMAEAGKHCKAHLLSDLLVVGELLAATIKGTYRIAQANLGLMEASPMRKEYVDKLEQLVSGSKELYESVEKALVGFLGSRLKN
jgi:formiminotetrahydrofolate cyclodeaminase